MWRWIFSHLLISHYCSGMKLYLFHELLKDWLYRRSVTSPITRVSRISTIDNDN
jgi:hypothetical protein